MQHVAVVTGVSGINGWHLAMYIYKNLPDWRVLGVSRRVPAVWPQDSRLKHISIDLQNENDCLEKFGTAEFAEVEFVYCAAYADTKDEARNCDVNTSMLRNTITSLDGVCKKLKHVTLVTGTKYYGVHLGRPIKIPSREDDPRHEGPNFYYPQEDFLREYQPGKQWHYSVLRPHEIVGYFPMKAAMDSATTIGLYAALCKELNLPFVFPGTSKSYETLLDFCSSDQLSAAFVFTSTSSSPLVQDQALNVVNGDIIRWVDLWPKVASYFNLEPVQPSESRKMSLTDMFGNPESEQNWDRIIQKYGLKEIKLSEVATWQYVDWSLSREYHCITDMSKAREAGFLQYRNTEKDFLAVFDEMKRNKIIP